MAKRKRKPPIATQTYRQRSAKLIQVAQGKPMLLQDIAKTLGTTYGGAQAQMTLLRKCGLPVPKVKRAKHNGFKDNVAMPEHCRVKISSYYPAGLQYSFKYQEEINGKLCWVYRLR